MATTSLSQSCIDIALDGDVILELSSNARYRVYSQVLCSASDVFNRMLSSTSSFSEATALRSRAPGAEPVVVPLEDDDAAVLLEILRVLHLQFKLVRQQLSIEELLQAAIICDKYLLHESLQLISSIWVQNSEPQLEVFPEKGLLISWVFGPETIFTKVSRTLMLGTSEDTQNGLVFGSERRELPEFVPAAITERIASSREKCLDAIRAEIGSLKGKYLQDDWETNLHCSAKLKQCDLLQLGLIYRSVLVSNAAIWNGSVDAIEEAVQKLEALNYENPPSTSQPSFAALYCPKCGLKAFERNMVGFWNGPMCDCIYYCHCPFCSSELYDDDFECHPCIVMPASRIHHTGAECSYVPKLKLEMNIILEDVRGLKFADFPSRTWI